MNIENQQPNNIPNQNNSSEQQEHPQPEQTVIHPFGSDKAISQEEIDKEQQYKETLTERD